MIIPKFKRIFKTDYKIQYQDLMEMLSFVLNTAFDTIYVVLNRGISLSDNVYCVKKDIVVQVDATGNVIGNTVMSLDLTQFKVIGTTVLFATNQTNPNVFTTGQPFINFLQTNDGLKLNNIQGLPPNNKFLLTIVAWG